MTDAELDALEKRVSGPFKSTWRKEMYYEAKILELIAELRQARAERDWFLNFLDRVCPPPTLRDNDACSSIDLNITCNDCWLKAAKKDMKHD